MKDCTYYDLLGVSMDADEKEIADAKNFLVKKLHPDANIDSRFDTTSYIQNVLTAYRILSNPDSRRVYDRRIRNPVRRETQRSGPGSVRPWAPGLSRRTSRPTGRRRTGSTGLSARARRS